jgi:outer membrane protein TolC
MRTRLTLLVPLVLVLAPRVAAGQGPPEPQLGGASVVPAALSAPGSAAGQNPFMGGVPAGQVTSGMVRLSVSDAVARGLKQNLGALLGEQATRLADAGRWNALSALLPNVTGDIRETREILNLEAFGFPLPPGTNPLVGPFNVFDIRASVTQNVFDYSAIEGARAGSAAARAAKYSYQDARDMVVFVTTNLYLQAVSGGDRIDAARAQLKTAQTVYGRAVDMKNAGTVPGIEVLRAQVQMQAQQQRVIFLENEFAKEKLVLARAIGLPLGQAFELADAMPYAALPPLTLDDSLRQAYDSRADLKSLFARVKAAEASKRAAYGTNLPSLAVAADFGDIGQTVASAKQTYTLTANLRVPIFEGGRARARLQQADAELRQERAQLDDLRARIEYEVRSALLDVKAADDRVQVARGAADLAGQQLTQSEDRFAAGVTSNLEVVQAQEAVAAATENYLSSLFAHNAAKIALARALGQAEGNLPRFLGGVK